MARSLKTRGLMELESFKKRVVRQRNLGRISAKDQQFLLEKVGEITTRIVRMAEDQTDEEMEI